MNPADSRIPESVGIQGRLTDFHIEEWLKEDALQARWWALVGMLCAVTVTWLMLVNKAKMKEICLFAALALILALGLDEYGDELVLWDYPTDVIPIFRPLTSINLMMQPAVFSLVYQRFRAWKTFVPAALAASALMCFAVEPLLSWGGFYVLVHWRYYFSLPIYFGLAILAKYLVDKILSVAGRDLRHA